MIFSHIVCVGVMLSCPDFQEALCVYVCVCVRVCVRVCVCVCELVSENQFSLFFVSTTYIRRRKVFVKINNDIHSHSVCGCDVVMSRFSGSVVCVCVCVCTCVCTCVCVCL